MTDITIVTAFFDIGREKYQEIPRSKQKYFDYFKRWARIKNDLIFCCENQAFADEVLKIRGSFGLKEKTHIIIVDDIFKVEPKLLEQFEKIENDEKFLNFRLEKTCTENIAKYNYIMFMKFYSVYLASQQEGVGDTLAWMDFGFEHGGEAFENEEAYNFEWRYDFGDKVNLFYIDPIDVRPIFEICRTVHPDSMMGAPVIVPKKICDEFYLVMRECYYSLVEIGLMDDDQLYLLWASRKRPDIIKTNPSDWFLPIAQYSNGTFKVKPKCVKKSSLIIRIKNKLKRIWCKVFHGKNR